MKKRPIIPSFHIIKKSSQYVFPPLFPLFLFISVKNNKTTKQYNTQFPFLKISIHSYTSHSHTHTLHFTSFNK